ncbi:MAG: thiamine biosynthesis protein ThiF, partial [Oscillospiraceae bacterium]|nr:thiamine biosynthesis protein ThiF [Oscillospiraceae bacterium]
VAVSLARAGVGRLILIDFDRVDVSNLNRQQYKAAQLGEPKTEALADNLREIAPYISLETHDERLTEENAPSLLAGADIVCEAFARAEEKAMLVNTVLTRMPGKYIVAASGMAGLGSANAIRTRRLSETFFLCGDGESDVDREGTLFAPRVALCAAHEATAVLRILAGRYEV